MRLLADTSVWVDHFRNGNSVMRDYLSEGVIFIHPCVTGELACGNLKDRASALANLQLLPSAKIASGAEVLHLIEQRKLWGQGLGWVDAHLLAAAMLSHCELWTLDKSLHRAGSKLGINAVIPR